MSHRTYEAKPTKLQRTRCRKFNFTIVTSFFAMDSPSVHRNPCRHHTIRNFKIEGQTTLISKTKIIFTARKRRLGQRGLCLGISVQEVFSRGSPSRGSLSRGLCQGGLFPEGSPSRESLSGGSPSRGISIQGGLCPGGYLSGGSLSRGSLSGGSFPRGSLSRGSPSRGYLSGRPPVW